MALLSRLVMPLDWPKPLLLAVGYFLGISVLLLLWRCFTLPVQNAYLALGIALFMMLFTGDLSLRSSSARLQCRNTMAAHLPQMITVMAFLTLFGFLYWVVPTARSFEDNPHVPVGSFEGGRYANIASFVAETNRLPVFKQNYGQSLLAAIPSLFGLPHPYLAMMLWLYTSLVAVLFFLYGLCRKLGAEHRLSLFTSAALLAAGPRLTFLVVQVTDNHSVPLLHNAYADTLISIGSLFSIGALLAWGMEPGRDLGKRCVMLFVACMFLLASGWTLTGIHMGVVALFILGTIFLHVAFRKDIRRLKIIIAAGIAVTLGIILTLPFGGSLSPQQFISADLVPGLMISPTGQGMNIDPVVNSSYNSFPNPFDWGFMPVNNFVNIYTMQWQNIQAAYGNITTVEAILWDHVRSLFFPLLGFALFPRAARLLKGDAVSRHWRGMLLWFSIASIAIGLVFTLFLRINHVQWELLRFLNAGYFGGMLFFVMAMGIALEAAPSRLRKAGIYCLLFISCAGPVSGMAMQIDAAYGRMRLTDKISFLTTMPVFTNDYSPKHQEKCSTAGAEDYVRFVSCIP